MKINSRKLWAPLPQKDNAVHNVCALAVRIQHLLEAPSDTLMRVFPNKNPPFSSFRAGLVWSPHSVTTHIWLCLIIAGIWDWAWHWLTTGPGLKLWPRHWMAVEMCLLNSKLDLSLLFWQRQFFIALKSENFLQVEQAYIMFYLIYLNSNYALYKWKYVVFPIVTWHRNGKFMPPLSANM